MSPKEGLACSSAELVNGTTLRVPGDFCFPSVPEDPSSFLTRLRHSMRCQQFVPTRWHGSPNTYLPTVLHTASDVYVRRSGYKPPLARPYAHPFLLLSKSDEYFTLEVNGKTEEITLDRLKPAKLEQDHAPPASTAPVPLSPQPAVVIRSSPPNCSILAARVRHRMIGTGLVRSTDNLGERIKEAA